MLCPNCHAETLKLKKGDYKEGDHLIKNSEWEECSNCGAKYFGPKMLEKLTKAYYVYNSILPPHKIRQKRNLYNKTQKQLATELCVSEITIKRWEKGTYIPPIEKNTLMKEIFEKWERENFRDLEADNRILDLINKSNFPCSAFAANSIGNISINNDKMEQIIKLLENE